MKSKRRREIEKQKRENVAPPCHNQRSASSSQLGVAEHGTAISDIVSPKRHGLNSRPRHFTMQVNDLFFVQGTYLGQQKQQHAINKISSATAAGLAQFSFDKHFVILFKSMPHPPGLVVRQLAEAASIHGKEITLHRQLSSTSWAQKTSSPCFRWLSFRSLYSRIAQWCRPYSRERECFRGHLLSLAPTSSRNCSNSCLNCARLALVASTLLALFS